MFKRKLCRSEYFFTKMTSVQREGTDTAERKRLEVQRKKISTVLRFSLDEEALNLEKGLTHSPDFSDEQEHWNSTNSSHSSSGSSGSSSGIHRGMTSGVRQNSKVPIFAPITSAVSERNNSFSRCSSSSAVIDPAMALANSSTDRQGSLSIDSSCLPATGWNYVKQHERDSSDEGGKSTNTTRRSKTDSFVSLTLSEISTIRQALSKAKLENIFEMDKDLYELLRKAKACFVCKVVRFRWPFGARKEKCCVCQCFVCEGCARQINLPTNQLERIPIHTLSPTQSATPRSAKCSCPHKNVSGSCAKCRDVQVEEKLQNAINTVPRRPTSFISNRTTASPNLCRSASHLDSSYAANKSFTLQYPQGSNSTTSSGDSGYNDNNWRSDRTNLVSSYTFAQELIHDEMNASSPNATNIGIKCVEQEIAPGPPTMQVCLECHMVLYHAVSDTSTSFNPTLSRIARQSLNSTTSENSYENRIQYVTADLEEDSIFDVVRAHPSLAVALASLPSNELEMGDSDDDDNSSSLESHERDDCECYSDDEDSDEDSFVPHDLQTDNASLGKPELCYDDDPDDFTVHVANSCPARDKNVASVHPNTSFATSDGIGLEGKIISEDEVVGFDKSSVYISTEAQSDGFNKPKVMARKANLV